MTEAVSGSVVVETPPAGSPPAANGLPGQGSPPASDDPLAGLAEPGSRDWAEKNGIKSLPDAVKAAREAQALIGRSVQVPGDDAKPDEVDKYLDKATAKYRPKDAAGYEYKLADGLPEDFNYDKDFAAESKTWAAEGKLTSRQAQLLHDKWVAKQADAHKAAREAFAKRVNEASDALVKDWGPLEGEKFKGESEMALRALRGLELEDSFHSLGLLAQIGNDRNIVVDPKVAHALATVGRAMFKEDTLVTGTGGGAAGNNPFATGNATEQNILWNKDRAKAMSLIQAAGKTPADFGYRA